MKIEEVVSALQGHIGKDKIELVSRNKYFVDSGLMLLSNADSLPIYIVEIDDKCYFADYGETCESLNLSENNKRYNDLVSECGIWGIDLNNGRLSVEIEDDPYVDYNKFVLCQMIIQSR